MCAKLLACSACKRAQGDIVTRDDVFQFRCSTAWKETVQEVAKKNNVSVAAMIHYTVNQLLADSRKQEFMKKVMNSKEKQRYIQEDLRFEERA